MSAHNLAEALRLAREWFNHEEAGVGPQAPQPAQAVMAPEYAAAVRELAEQSGMSGAQVLRAAIRLYQAERKGLVTVEHKEQIGPLAAPQPEAQPPGFVLVQIAELTKWKSLANSLAVLSLKSERTTTAIILKSLIQDAIDAAPSAQAEQGGK